MNMADYFGLIKTEDLINLIKKTPSDTELILTGRNASKKLIQFS